METFFWTIAAALVSGLATIAWTNPSFFTGVLVKYLSMAGFTVQVVFQVWDLAIGFMLKKVGNGIPSVPAGELLAISQNAKIPDAIWLGFYGSVVYMLVLLVLAFSKDSHDIKSDAQRRN